MARKEKKMKRKTNPSGDDFNYEFATGMGLATDTAGSSSAVTKKGKGGFGQQKNK
ncbi:MAG: hypothetical protein GX262_09365 [Clostridia bacterium]|jgi:hypothetical protein|nr:hypothetical protein [Clostridia bacterium]